MKIYSYYDNFCAVSKTRAILVFSYRYRRHVEVHHHRLSWIEKSENRDTAIGQWIVKRKKLNTDGYKFK